MSGDLRVIGYGQVFIVVNDEQVISATRGGGRCPIRAIRGQDVPRRSSGSQSCSTIRGIQRSGNRDDSARGDRATGGRQASRATADIDRRNRTAQCPILDQSPQLEKPPFPDAVAVWVWQ